MPDAIFVFIRYPFNTQSLVSCLTPDQRDYRRILCRRPPEQIVHFKSPVSLAARRNES
jgi:hypothetical protein